MRSILVLLFLPNLMACSLSMESYQELAAQVRERNRVRHAQAEDALRARGFEGTNEGSGQAVLGEPLRQRCLDALISGTALAPESETIEVQDDDGTAFEWVVSAPDVCAFFGHETSTLEGAKEGQSVSMTRSARPMVRDAEGRRFYLDVEFDVVSERVVTVDVERPCNLMPTVDPHPLEMYEPERVLFNPLPAENVVMQVEREDLDIRCSENVY